MELHLRRKQKKEVADAEAAGQSFWTDEFTAKTRSRIETVLVAMRSALQFSESSDVARQIDLMMRNQLGLSITSSGYIADWSDVRTYLGGCDDAVMPSFLEATFDAFTRNYVDVQKFVPGLNVILREERVAFEFIADQMVEIESTELHAEVVAPVLRLLSGRAGWADVETAYHNALHELAGGDPADAITDAGTALQEALTLLGCKGNSLGPLIDDAAKRGLIAKHDKPLLHWVSADRSTTGDAHGVTGASRQDAWLAVHVVGAIILRLASGAARGKP